MPTEPMSNDEFYNYEDYVTELKHIHEMVNKKLLQNKNMLKIRILMIFK